MSGRKRDNLLTIEKAIEVMKAPHLIPECNLCLAKGDRILLIRRANTGYQDGQYAPVAGHVEQGEDFITAMIREAREEVGLILSHGDLRVAHIMYRLAYPEPERIAAFVVADRWVGEPVIMEPDKCDDVQWFAFNALPANMIPYARTGIQHVREGALFYSTVVGRT